jgi:squalene synthase HpnC
MSVQHYENFPVASVLCPPVLRPAIAAIYHFARTADDLADEGDATAEQRLADLVAYRADLVAASTDQPTSARWADLFAALARQIDAHRLPVPLLHDLLSAFEQDVRYTAKAHRYSCEAELLDYCRLSANPVGRLLLHLYGVSDAVSLAQSDDICSALQLINFWQDLSVDIPRGRHYLPLDACARHGVTAQMLDQRLINVNTTNLIAEQAHSACLKMLSGSPLATRIPGRAGWELRLVVQGGLRILHKLESHGHNALAQRHTVRAWDVVPMLWRAWRMG